MQTTVRLARLIWPYRKYFIVAFLAVLGDTATSLLQPWPLKMVFDNVFRSKPLAPVLATPITAVFGHGREGVLYFALVATVVLALLSGISTFIESFVMVRIANGVLFDLRRRLYWHIQRLSLSYHEGRRTGDLSRTLMNDAQYVQDMIASGVLDFVVSILTLIGMVVVMFALNWRFALIALSITPFLFATVYRYTPRIKRASRAVRRKDGAISSIVQEVLSSMRVVQAYTREDFEQSRFERENRQLVAMGIQASTLRAALGPVADLLVAIGTVLVLWYGAHEVLAQHLTVGTLLVYIAYLGRLYSPMRDLSKLSDTMYRASVGMERIFDVLETERSVRDLPGARAAGPLRGQIAFEHVSFGYRAKNLVLKDISFSVEPGQVVALVGSTGAGKTTLASLIPRFNDPARGSVRVDGRDVRSYMLASLRSQIALVLQETILFYGTVRENIAYGRPEATLEEIIAAAKTANAHAFITALPDGYETLIGERGVTLSGGQRQRIALARAIIRDAPILLLDEPTTGLDASSEALVVEGMARLMAERTVLVIAHRLSTIMRADLILVLEHGEIVERGTHQELLTRGGRYAELYELQFRGQAPVPHGDGLGAPHGNGLDARSDMKVEMGRDVHSTRTSW
jgi:ATP-binding cassette, subfamily B, bacterial